MYLVYENIGAFTRDSDGLFKANLFRPIHNYKSEVIAHHDNIFGEDTEIYLSSEIKKKNLNQKVTTLKNMKVRNKFMIFLLFFSILLISIFVVNLYLSKSSLDYYIKNQTKKLESSINNSLVLNKESISLFVNDYTIWDELRDFILTPDSSFAEDNLTLLLGNNQVDYLWTYTLAGNNVFTNQKENYHCIPDIINPNILYNSFDTTENSKKRYLEFYSKNDTVITMVCGATIHASDDREKIQKPAGFLFLAKRIDNSFLKKIGIITHSKVTLFSDSIQNIIENDDKIYFIKNLYNSNNKYVASLLFINEDNYINEIETRSKTILSILALIIFFSLILLLILFQNTFLKPFGKVITSLNTSNTEYIQPYIDKKGEIGQLSSLINSFFIQKLQLTSEIEQKVKILEKIEEQNIELQNINQKIQEQSENLTYAFRKIEFQNSELNSSIEYASRIQNTILTPIEKIKVNLDIFIIFKPKDIVSGDFYWYSHIKPTINKKEMVLLAAVDCTGHGVPGAILSMVGSRLISKIVVEEGITDTNQILTALLINLIETLNKEHVEITDGMDVCLCRFEKADNKKTDVYFCGAKRPLFYKTKNSGEIKILKGDRKTIAWTPKSLQNIEFTEQKITLEKGDMVYLTTDGYYDQNDISREKIGMNKFMEIIAKNAEKNTELQKEELEKYFDIFRNGTDQRDDVTVIGVKI